jgi:hypothetical protein
MPITDRQIDQACADLKAIHGNVREDYFGLLYVEQEFDVPREKALRQIGFGGNDYGLDGFHIDVHRRNLYLFQFKCSTSPALFKGSFKRLIDAGIDRVFGSPNIDRNQNQLLLQLQTRLLEDRNVIDQVLIHFVFRGDPEEAERSLVLDKLREDLEAKNYVLDEYFGRHVTMGIQFRTPSRVAAPTHTRVTHTYPIEMEQPVKRVGPNGEEMYTGFIRLIDLHGMYHDMNQRFFERNIRAGLSEEAAPNRAITKALSQIVLDQKESPAVFAFNHNGVTMYAERLERVDGRFQITEPRLLNGAQTVTTLDRFLKKNEGNPRLKQGDDLLHQLSVLCKVITKAKDNFVVTVTINNNRQNPIMPWNLRANDDIQLELHDKFLRDLKLYYERQENAFENLTRRDLEEMEIEEDKAIELLKLAQTFLASDGEIDKISRMGEVFENDRLYSQVFDMSRLKADSGQILLCYKIQFRLRRLIREILDRGAKRYAYMGRGRNLMWALLCQGVLNSDDLSERIEAHGRSMIILSDFTDWLRHLTSARVRFLISDLVEKKPYSEMIAAERYDFLRTKAVYDNCMEIAHRKWKWVQQRLK